MIIRDNNIQKWLFDYFEGNLTPHEEIELNNFISQNPSYQSEFDAWQKAYPSKEAKSKRNRVPVYAGASTLLVETSIWARFNWKYAATILALITGGVLIGFLNTPDENLSSEGGISITNTSTSQDIESNSTQVNEKKDVTNNEEFINTVVDSDGTSSQLEMITSNDVEDDKRAANENRDVTSSNDENSQTLNVLDKEEKILNNDEKLEASEILLIDKSDVKSESDNPSVFRNGNSKNLEKVELKPVVFFDVKVEKKLHKDASSSDYKRKKRYYYAGFKDLKGRGIGVHGKRAKADKDLEKDNKASDLNLLITENGGGAEGNIEDPEKKRKRHRHAEIALMNLYDPIFVTTNSHPLTINSALAGELGIPRIKSSFRLQKNNSKDVITNSLLSYDMYIEELKAGVGLVVGNNRLNDGVYSQNSIDLIYAQKFEISRETFFSASLKYSGKQNRINASKINYNSSVEVAEGIVYNTYSDATFSIPKSKLRHDMGIAAWYDGQYLYGGFEIDNLLRSKDFVYNETQYGNKTPMQISAQIGTDYRKSLYSDWVISPQLNFTAQGGYNELWVGTSVKFRSLVAGVGVGTLNTNTYKGMIGLQNHSVRVMYGFDYSNSALESGMFASHEVSLRVLLGVKRKNWSRFKN